MTDWAAEAVTRGDVLLMLLSLIVLFWLRLLFSFLGARPTQQ